MKKSLQELISQVIPPNAMWIPDRIDQLMTEKNLSIKHFSILFRLCREFLCNPPSQKEFVSLEEFKEKRISFKKIKEILIDLCDKKIVESFEGGFRFHPDFEITIENEILENLEKMEKRKV